MDRTEFERLVRDALNSLYDQAALQTHPLVSYLAPTAIARRSRAEQLREALVAAIERLRPAERDPGLNAPEWRPYLLLLGRYVEGESLPELQARLALSERQLRREHGRAIEAVAGLLWDQVFPDRPAISPAGALPAEETAGNDFSLAPGPLDMVELIQGVAATLRRRIDAEGGVLEVQSPAALPRALADRVILRQVLLSLLGHAFDATADGRVVVEAGVQGARVVVWIRYTAGEATDVAAVREQRTLTNAQPWALRLQAELESQTATDQPAARQWVMRLPRADQPLILIVDDQEVALRLYQRYLSQTGVHLIGLRDGGLVADEARRRQPQAVILDVMMPNMDGWEVLQTLQADPATRHIPVVVCSVWEEPELAFSLGAADFLRKPITQREFLAALARLGLLGA